MAGDLMTRQLIAMTFAAALVAFGLWLTLAVLFSLGSYIPSLP